MTEASRILLVDDEAPARTRLKYLLTDIAESFPNKVVAEAADGVEALEKLAQVQVDIALVDIRMPRMDGIEFAQQIVGLETQPSVVFVSAYDEFALKAFELAAADYLVKPVRASRLLDALLKARRLAPNDPLMQALSPAYRNRLRVVERGQVLLVPLAEVLFLRAEQKYVVARTREREYLLDESLSHLESEFSLRFVRIHRNCLVARDAVAGVTREGGDENEGESHWALLLKGTEERLPVSRRQWSRVKVEFGL